MAGGGSSELQELKEMVDGIIEEMKERIRVLEGLMTEYPPSTSLRGGGGTSGEKSVSKKVKVKGKARKSRGK